jgi:transposase
MHAVGLVDRVACLPRPDTFRMSDFRLIDRDTGFLMPPSVDEWLPERHLARFVVEVIAGLDLREMTGSYRGSGEASYHPQLLLGLIIYGYTTGVFSSRKLERATFDSVAFRFIAANEHPDHDTIAAFRRRFLPQIEGLFVQVLDVAREMGVLELGTWLPSVPAARPRQCSRRVDPGDYGVEHEADVRPAGCGLSQIAPLRPSIERLAGGQIPIEAAKLAATTNLAV